MGGIAQDKARVQMNLPTSINSSQGGKEAMQALAQEFRELSEQHKADQLKEKQANAIPGECTKID